MTLVIDRQIQYPSDMARKYDDPNKLTAKDAIAFLEIKEHMFYALVRQGEIPKHVDRLRTHAYYLRSELEEFMSRYERGEVPPIHYPKKNRRSDDD